MAVPGDPSNPTAITLGKIYQEIDGSGYTNAVDSGEEASLEDMSKGNAPDSINQNSTNKPNGTEPHSMSEFLGYNHTPFTWGSNSGVTQQWGSASGTSQFTALGLCTIGFAFQPASNRVRIRSSNGTNSIAISYAYNNITYTGTDPDQCEFKIVWSGAFGGTGTSVEGSGSTSGTYYTMAKQSTSSDSGSFTDRTWSVQKSSGAGSHIYNAIGSNGPKWTVRGKDSGGTVVGTSGTSNANAVSLSANRNSGGGFGGGEPICIHEDMLVNTEFGPMHIKDVVEKDPRLWSYNHNTKQKELVEQIQNVQVLHDNLYIINNEFMITEDHVMYGKEQQQYSIIPELTLKHYGMHAQELEIGHVLSTLSGDKFVVNSIERYEGEHLTYTISTKNKNFYANDILVDSEI